MVPKIDTAQMEVKHHSDFVRGFIWKILVTTILFLLIIIFGYQNLHPNPGVESRGFSPGMLSFPWLMASGLTIQNGLSRFSYESGGNEPFPTSTDFRVWTLISVLMFYIVTPTLCFFGWRRNRIRSAQERVPISMRHVLYITACIPLIINSIFPLAGIIIHERVRSSLREANAIQENRDHIINELNSINNSVREYYLLPKEFGGGDGSLKGYQIPAELASTLQSTYSCKIQDDMLSIEAQSVKYPGALVRVKINGNGRLYNWEYEGKLL